MSPIYDVKKIPLKKIKPNDYNINYISPIEYELLKKSIIEDGLTQPIVCRYEHKNDIYEIIDGYYRYKIIKEDKSLRKREQDSIAVVLINKPLKETLTTHIRHNRTRGEFYLNSMIRFIKKAFEIGIDERWLEEKFLMSKDEIFRLKQLSGDKKLFKDRDFSKEWLEEIKKEIKDDCPA
jgi:ParB-like chromosome segregation protein Spo0J